MQIIDELDLASYLPGETQDGRWAMVVELANGLVSGVLGDPTGEPTTRMKAITLEVAARAIRNPDGYSSETVDDYTYRLPEETRRAGVYLTPNERADLDDLLGTYRRSFVGWLA